LLDLAIGTLFEAIVVRPHTPHRHFPHHRAPPDFLRASEAGPLAHHTQRVFRHRAFHAAPSAIVQLARLRDAIIVEEQGVGERTEVNEMMPGAVVAGQA
jgi:hypothetical protein